MEKKTENEMETLGPFKGVYRDYRVVCRYSHLLPSSKNLVQHGVSKRVDFDQKQILQGPSKGTDLMRG